jgi:hypothetical protein
VAFVDSLRLQVANLMYKGTILAASESSRVFAPKGWSLQLSRGIRAEKPYIASNGDVVGVITSTARTKKGKSYAGYQHNLTLRHITKQPLLLSFGDGQKGRTAKHRYNLGLAKAVREKRGEFYATEYLTKGVESQRETIVNLLLRAIQDA